MPQRQALAERANQLAVDLLSQRESSQNVVLSPSSLHSALGLLLLGAGGECREQILGLLEAMDDVEQLGQILARRHAASTNAHGPVAVALALFVAQALELEPSFTERIRRDLGGEVRGLAFGDDSSVRTINDWVEQATGGHIPRLVETVAPDTRMLLVSALHFRSDWAAEFDVSLTFDRPFKLLEGKEITVPTMHMKEAHPLWLGEDWQVLELGYKHPDHAMLIALPPAQRPDEPLDIKLLAQGIDELAPQLVQLQLPRFTITANLALRSELSHCGMVAAFREGEADFSGISKTPLHVSDVIHKAYVAVTELGTEAAAVTGVPAMQSIDRREAVPFTVDRPFWFAIRDRRTATLEFLGRVVDPRG